MRKLYLAAIFSCLLAIFVPSQTVFAVDDPAAAADSPHKFLKIPVYYITDRNRLKDARSGELHFGQERKYPGKCKHDLDLGVAYCSIRNTENKNLNGSLRQLGWRLADKMREGPEGLSAIEAKQYAVAKASFYDQLHQQSQIPQDHEVFMFVPGYMSTFESGLRSAARLGYYSERPIILYSWASKGKFTEYMADESTVEWSQDHFNDVLDQLASLNSRGQGIQTRIFAHSMGGRLILRATPLLKTNPAVKEVSVICPDVDEGVVKHYAAKYFDGNSKLVIRLYISRRDMMLKLSQLVHGGYTRMGEDEEPLDVLLPDNASKSLGDCNVDGTQGTSAFSKGLMRRMVTVDFTVLDMAPFGHRIPVELITNISEKGQPCPGLTFRLFRPHSRAAAESELPTDADDAVLKVQRAASWHGIPLSNTMLAYRPRWRLLFTKDWTLN